MSGSLIPVNHELWMHDADTKTCLSCEAPFSTFRRRHHCRYCGRIFCNKCSFKKKEKVQGKALQRICVKCYSLYIKKKVGAHASQPSESGRSTPSSNQERNTTFSKLDSMSILEEDPVENRVFTFSNDIQHEIDLIRNEINVEDDWRGDCVAYLREKAENLVTAKGLRKEWTEVVVSLVINCISTICPSVQYRGDHMNLNKYLIFQHVIAENEDFSFFLSGVAFEKNLAHRKMSKSMQNPKILLINEISEGNPADKSLVSMDNLIDQELSLTGITLKKILSINPSMIVCLKGLPQPFLAELAKKNITALINVKSSLMELLARATLGKILNSSDEIHHERNFMGECNSFFQETRAGNLYVHFTGLHDLSLAGTIFLSGPNQAELSLVEKIIRKLAVEYRNVRLERGLFASYSKQSIPRVFNEYYDSQTTFKHFAISENKMCIKPEVYTIEFYKEKDMALGEFLIETTERTEQRCKDCSNTWGAHTLYYIKKNSRVKVGFSKSAMDISNNDIFHCRECKICMKTEQVPAVLNRSLWEYSFYKFLNNFFKNNPIVISNRSCKHDFYKHSRFIFFIRAIKVSIQWEDNPCYNVISMNSKPDMTEFYSEMLRNNLAELKTNISDLIEFIVVKYRELSNKVIKDIAEEVKVNQGQVLDEFTQELDKNYSKLKSCLKAVQELECTSFTNLMQIETKRRELFFEICDIRLSVASSIPFRRNSRRRERNYLGDAVSSSGDSSGDTRKSSSPSRSLMVEEEKDGFLRPQSSLSSSKLIEKILRVDDFFLKNEFSYLQRGNLSLPLGRNGLCVPVEESDILSIIAYSLNSKEYFNEVLSLMPDVKDTEKIESELLNCNERHFQHQFTTLEDEHYLSPSRDELTTLFGQHVTFNVHMFFPRQFQIIRDKVTSHIDFITGILSSESKKEQLGKSKATFTRSFSNLYILKVLDEKEFGMFKELAPNYFRHFCNEHLHDMPCLMVRTLGCFRVYSKNHTLNRSKCEWVMLFENLSCNMPKDIAIYDLKGAFNNRRFNNKEVRTKMDMNFLEDFSGLPLMLSKEAKKLIDVSIWNDTLFLSKQNIVDYSLLVVVSNNCKSITLGIIDYIAKYTFEKAIEHNYKKVVGTDDPTIIKPHEYKVRFRESIADTFFVEFIE